MSSLFLQSGPNLIGKLMIAYLGNNREKVNSYLTNELKIRYKPSTEIEDFLTGYTFCIEPEKLPPVEYLILRKSLKPIELEKIPEKINAPPEIVKKAILELQLKGMIFIKEDKIEINWRKKDLFEKKMIKPYWPLNK